MRALRAPKPAPGDGPALAFLVAGAAWFLVGTLYGMLSAIQLVVPEAFDGTAWLVFGRTRPAHVNTVIYGFVASTLVGAGLHYVPALLGTRLWSPRLAWASFALWTGGVLAGLPTLAAAVSQGREYAEYAWPIDLALLLALLTLVFNLVMTVAVRRENVLYVSVWYVVGAILWTSMTYPLGNVMWRPATGALPGIQDSIFLWFFGHNLIGLLLTPLALGGAYYVFPRVCRTPLFSHLLGLLGFWLLLAMYTHTGGHHLLQAPVPQWFKTIAVVDSVAMVVPVVVVLANLWLTARGRLGAMWRDPGGRWVLAGSIWYLLVGIQGAAQSLPVVQTVTHFSNWVVGHAHIAVLGFSGSVAVGTLWHVLPDASGRRLWSPGLAHLQFALVTVGLVLMFSVLTVAGLVQGAGWRRGDSVYEVLPSLRPYLALRALSGVLIVAGAGVGLFGVVMTLWRGEPCGAAASGEGEGPADERSDDP